MRSFCDRDRENRDVETRGNLLAVVQIKQAIALYDPARHKPITARFGQDVGVTILSWRSRALWDLGYPDAALADVQQALKIARAVGQAPTLIYALLLTAGVRTNRGRPFNALTCTSKKHQTISI
jgi:hypothetical protein